MKLFVYGTLRHGERAHHLLRGARLLVEARTAPGFTLLDLGEYPALLEGGGGTVAGEIYEVDEPTLAELDEYEEVPEVYLRVERLIGDIPVWVYVLRPVHAAAWPPIPSGDWRRRGSR